MLTKHTCRGPLHYSITGTANSDKDCLGSKKNGTSARLSKIHALGWYSGLFNNTWFTCMVSLYRSFFIVAGVQSPLTSSMLLQSRSILHFTDFRKINAKVKWISNVDLHHIAVIFLNWNVRGYHHLFVSPAEHSKTAPSPMVPPT